MTRLPILPNDNTALADLSEQERHFVREFVEIGHRKGGAIDAAIAAGYGRYSREQAKSAAYRLARKPSVLAAIRNELSVKLNHAAALGVHVLVDLAQNAKSEQTRLSAARELVDRGYGPVISRSAVLSASLSVEDFLDQLDRREREGAAAPHPPTIDAQYSQVADATDSAPDPSEFIDGSDDEGDDA